jgi:sulfite reductase (NADPH) flavoprotein alpha-component
MMTNMTERINPFTRTNPLNASIRERHLLCKPGSSKRTSHIVLELPDPAFTYEVGDSIGVYSPNDAAIVDKTLQAMGYTGDEMVVSKRSGETFSFREFLIHSASITDFSKKMLKDIMERQTNSEKREHLESVFADKEQVKAYIKNREVWDLMLDHPSGVCGCPHAESAAPLFDRLFTACHPE